jgi:hypothetical protein
MGEYDEHAYRRSGRKSWLTLISGQFIYLIVIVIALLRRLDDALLLLHKSRPQLRRLWSLWWERWLQVRTSGYHLRRTHTSPWRIKQFIRWRIFSDLVGGERAVERTSG